MADSSYPLWLPSPEDTQAIMAECDVKPMVEQHLQEALNAMDEGFPARPLPQEQKKVNDGGYAFPSPIAADSMGGLNFAGSYPNTGGMSLRDWFAGQALAGVASTIRESTGEMSHEAKMHAMFAYLLADAMLAAREATGAHE